MLALSLVTSAAIADEPEPIKIVFDAPPGCPDQTAFGAEVRARTARARIAAPGESARTFKVSITKRRGARHGTLRIEDTGGQTDVREVDAPKCAEVSSALALIAALAIDPHASTAAIVIPPPGALPGALPAVVGTEAGLNAPVPIEVKMPWYAGLGANPGMPALRLLAGAEWPFVPYPLPAYLSPEREEPSHAVFSLGLHVAAMSAASPSVTPSFAPYIDVAWITPGIFSPSIRLSFVDGLSTDTTGTGGSATFHLIAGRLDACPVRGSFGAAVTIAPCAGLTVGVINASGQGVVTMGTGTAFGESHTTPWGDVPIVARAQLFPLRSVVVEAQAGLIFPLVRTRFRLDPEIVHEVPAVGGTASVGAGLRFW